MDTEKGIRRLKTVERKTKRLTAECNLLNHRRIKELK
jgi:hypothetical protein